MVEEKRSRNPKADPVAGRASEHIHRCPLEGAGKKQERSNRHKKERDRPPAPFLAIRPGGFHVCLLPFTRRA